MDPLVEGQRHCAFEGCNQLDFLPFKCDCCDRVFCLAHRSYSAHSCPKSGGKDRFVLVCPICNQSFPVIDGEDANLTWERHSASTACNPANFNTAKKKKCPVKGCKVRSYL